MTLFLSTLMRSWLGSALLPSSVTTRPFTRTRPSVINVSACRRDASPPRARIFCRRSVFMRPRGIVERPNDVRFTDAVDRTPRGKTLGLRDHLGAHAEVRGEDPPHHQGPPALAPVPSGEGRDAAG